MIFQSKNRNETLETKLSDIPFLLKNEFHSLYINDAICMTYH